jgi:hypothetical protein
MSVLPRAKIRNKNNAPRQYVLYDTIAPLMGINGPVIVKRIEDYPLEDQQRWANLKQRRDADGERQKRPISGLEMLGRVKR